MLFRSKTTSQMDAEFRKRAVEREEAESKRQKDQDEEKNRLAQCSSSRANLAQLESGQRISRFDEKGERTFLEDDERPKAIADARKAVDSWCSPPKR